MSLNYIIGNNIKKLRLNNKLTQEQLASELQISRTNITHYEQGKRKPKLEMIIKISEYFNVSIDYLVGRCE